MQNKMNFMSIWRYSKMLGFLIGFALMSLSSSIAQDLPSTYLITGIEIYTAVGEPIDNGAVGVQNGMITYIGKASRAPKEGYEATIDKTGMRLYPGLIAANTTLGLTEIFAVRATADYREVGDMNPNVRSISAYNAESEISETVLANGVLFAQVCPRGGVISGTSSVVVLDGWNWEDAVYHMDEGIHMTWPRLFKRERTPGEPTRYTIDEKYEVNLREIRTFFDQAKAYAKRAVPLERDLRMESMRGIFSGEKRLYIAANNVKEIREAIAFKRELEIPKVTIVGGYDSWMAADLLRENEISVMVGRVNELPRFPEDPIDANYTLPSKLAAANVLFCLEMDGDMETMQNRNLPFNAGTAIGYGLSEADALRAVTINAAKILNIDSRTGSIEVGKEANFILVNGDLFDIRLSQIEAVYFQGKQIDTSTRQEILGNKYREKLSNDANSSENH
jgi:hypothetical protein